MGNETNRDTFTHEEAILMTCASDPMCTCRGQKCMGWRWSMSITKEEGQSGIRRNGRGYCGNVAEEAYSGG